MKQRTNGLPTLLVPLLRLSGSQVPKMTNRQRIKRHKKRDRARARVAALTASAQSHGLKILSVLDQHVDDLFKVARKAKDGIKLSCSKEVRRPSRVRP